MAINKYLNIICIFVKNCYKEVFNVYCLYLVQGVFNNGCCKRISNLYYLYITLKNRLSSYTVRSLITIKMETCTVCTLHAAVMVVVKEYQTYTICT